MSPAVKSPAEAASVTTPRVRCPAADLWPNGASDRLCLVCHSYVPDGLGVYQVHLNALVHQANCNVVIAGLEHISGCTPRDRWRPIRELIALANGARCADCTKDD